MTNAGYEPGDVVHFVQGPFWGVCGVVTEVVARGTRIRVDIDEGLVHREGGVLSVRRHNMLVESDEIELA